MMNSKLSNIVLWALLLLGFLGAAKISYSNMLGSACPHIGFIPICYIVLAAYGLMILSLIIPHMGCKHYFFCAGWGTAFVIALVGSIAEIASGGGVCPSSGGGGVRAVASGSVPMCFISLGMLVVILVLFLFGPYKRACDLQQN